MPNWCENTLIVTGNTTDLVCFKHQAKTEGGDFSFEPFLPMPEMLSAATASFPKVLTKEDKARIKATGFKDWYERNCKVLGTKWDVEGTIMESSKTKLGYTFNSAWSPPIQGVINISKQYPKLTFSLDFDEPGMDFAGTVVIRNGKILREENRKSGWNNELE